EGNILINEDFATLTQRAIHYHEGHLSADGAFVLPLNSISEVSPSNRYVVRDDQTKDLDWTKLHALTQRQFDNIKNEFVRKFNHETKT
ncbi:phosphoenolpyruvate carboxykinase (ATP), partial [Staphylococcus aureus]|nr:phosphoenolpyruvate carboxykinase (ATP) [Staphylococcus aureus]